MASSRGLGLGGSDGLFDLRPGDVACGFGLGGGVGILGLRRGVSMFTTGVAAGEGFWGSAGRGLGESSSFFFGMRLGEGLGGPKTSLDFAADAEVSDKVGFEEATPVDSEDVFSDGFFGFFGCFGGDGRGLVEFGSVLFHTGATLGLDGDVGETAPVVCLDGEGALGFGDFGETEAIGCLGFVDGDVSPAAFGLGDLGETVPVGCLGFGDDAFGDVGFGFGDLGGDASFFFFGGGVFASGYHS